jgi:predicted metal-dependent hydrolase
MLYPEAAREYVVVHELAHLVHMDHSPAFYALIERYLPDYKSRRKLLKDSNISMP